MVDDGKDGLEIAEKGCDLLAGPGLDPFGAADLLPPAAEPVDGGDVIGDALLGWRDGKFFGRENTSGGDGRPEPPHADPLTRIRLGSGGEPFGLLVSGELGHDFVVLPGEKVVA